jgi:guanylate kinase
MERKVLCSLGGLVLFGPGLLFVVSGPSGAGKDTLVDGLRARLPRLSYSVSATTRAPRPGELDGRDYFFMTHAAFEQMMGEHRFLETKAYNGNLYGTPRSFIEQCLSDGIDVIMKPEVNGALAIKKAFPDAVMIFLLPDKFSHLQTRLLERRTETTEQIAERIAIAHEEMAHLHRFDYLIINEEDHPDAAVDDLEAIVHAERFRIHRYSDDKIRKLQHS